jgi:hypothetical protein
MQAFRVQFVTSGLRKAVASRMVRDGALVVVDVFRTVGHVWFGSSFHRQEGRLAIA